MYRLCERLAPGGSVYDLKEAGLLASPGPGLLGEISNGIGFGAVVDDTAAGTATDSHRVPFSDAAGVFLRVHLDPLQI